MSPLTLLAGPSTSLRDDVVRCLVLRRPSVVAVVYEVGVAADGVALTRVVRDAAGVQHRERLPLVGCCLSCTVVDDAPEAVALVTAADRWDEVVLALPPSVRAQPLAAALSARDGVAVDTVTTLVDARRLRAQLACGELLADADRAAAPSDRRSLAELVVGQLEDADVLAVVGLDGLPTGSARTVEALLAHLAPLALPVQVGPGGAGCDDAVSTGRHDAGSRAADREELAALALGLCPPACGVTTVLWSADRPLHPGRLHAALRDVVHGVVRSRGHVALLNRPGHRVRWEGAGPSLSFGDPQRADGPPACSLLLTGVGLDPARVVALLDGSLATDDDGPVADRDDPFRDALGHAGSPALP